MTSRCPCIMQTFEDSHPFSGKGLTEEDQESRRDLVNLLIKLATQLGLLEQTVHDSVLLLDRLIRRGLGIRNLTSNVLLAAVGLIAAQQGASCHHGPTSTKGSGLRNNGGFTQPQARFVES